MAMAIWLRPPCGSGGRPVSATVRRAVGITPYQFLLNTRLRQAALRLLSTSDAVSAIAFESGFGDLSTFNNAFRDRFGANPLAFRRGRPLHRPASPHSRMAGVPKLP